ncbi:carboxypeptidase-like regulatory domain-containing protein [Maribacter antarcticus]|uniref:carboxypeptidase-like regulatory domain-containing protein n=1 Tax=Maribacter antarcticus TaxID=505250 RepID=UPI00047B44A2|nr:carboxypeptidase-like regulatory domain-containing protein [Maribacter antarcticus]
MNIKTILILTTSLIIAKVLHAQKTEISGNVMDESGNPLQDITVQLNPDGNYTSTDVSGYFGFSLAVEKQYTLKFSSIGFQTLGKRVSLMTNQQIRLEIIRKEATAALSEVTVIGKSKSQKVREGTVNVSVLETEQFRVRNTNTSDIIKQIPGVVVRQTGGFGSTAEVYLNGMTGKRTI